MRVLPLNGAFPAFGVSSAQFLERDWSIGALAEHAQLCESLGFDSLWVMDGVITDEPCLEPIALLGYLSAVTTRVTLGVGVIVAPTRGPVVLAKELATIDRLSQGRLVVGIGLGDETTPYRAFGIDRRDRAERLEETAQVMRRLWTEPRVTAAGSYGELVQAPLEPKPLQSHLPLWFGGSAPAALRRAARLGDGWIGAGASSTDDFRSRVAILRSLTRASKPDFTIGKRCYFQLAESRVDAVERTRRFFHAIYGVAELGERVLIGGNQQECVEQLTSVIECGPDVIVLNPVGDDASQVEQLPAIIAAASEAAADPMTER